MHSFKTICFSHDCSEIPLVLGSPSCGHVWFNFEIQTKLFSTAMLESHLAVSEKEGSFCPSAFCTQLQVPECLGPGWRSHHDALGKSRALVVVTSLRPRFPESLETRQPPALGLSQPQLNFSTTSFVYFPSYLIEKSIFGSVLCSREHVLNYLCDILSVCSPAPAFQVEIGMRRLTCRLSN